MTSTIKATPESRREIEKRRARLHEETRLRKGVFLSMREQAVTRQGFAINTVTGKVMVNPEEGRAYVQVPLEWAYMEVVVHPDL